MCICDPALWSCSTHPWALQPTATPPFLSPQAYGSFSFDFIPCTSSSESTLFFAIYSDYNKRKTIKKKKKSGTVSKIRKCMWFRELSETYCSNSILKIKSSSSRLTGTNVSVALLSFCLDGSRWHQYAHKSCQAATAGQSTWTTLI